MYYVTGLGECIAKLRGYNNGQEMFAVFQTDIILLKHEPFKS